MDSDYALMAFANKRISLPVENSRFIGNIILMFINPSNEFGNSCSSCRLEKPQGYRNLTY